jgi:hypothetical protein
MTTLDRKKIINRVCAQLRKCDSVTEKACMDAETSWLMLPDSKLAVYSGMEGKEVNEIVGEIIKIHNKLGDVREMLGKLVWWLEKSITPQ